MQLAESKYSMQNYIVIIYPTQDQFIQLKLSLDWYGEFFALNSDLTITEHSLVELQANNKCTKN